MRRFAVTREDISTSVRHPTPLAVTENSASTAGRKLCVGTESTTATSPSAPSRKELNQARFDEFVLYHMTPGLPGGMDEDGFFVSKALWQA